VAAGAERTTQSTPAAAPHWSTRKKTTELGVSAAAGISRHWRANCWQSHLARGCKLPCAPWLVKQLEAGAGVSMSRTITRADLPRR